MEMEIERMKMMMMNKRKMIKINRYFECFILGKINNDLCKKYDAIKTKVLIILFIYYILIICPSYS